MSNKKRKQLKCNFDTEPFMNLPYFEREKIDSIITLISNVINYQGEEISCADQINFYIDQIQLESIKKEILMPYTGIRIQEGASKICITYENFPWVVKFSNSPDFDECVKELAIYQEAQRQNLDKFFPRTIWVPNSPLVYGETILQEKINFLCSERYMHPTELHQIEKITHSQSITKNHKKIYHRVNADMQRIKSNYRRNVSSQWIQCAISLYGKMQVKELCKFIHNYNISDLHDSNIGYKCITKHNHIQVQPMIFDFSGYDRPENY